MVLAFHLIVGVFWIEQMTEIHSIGHQHVHISRPQVGAKCHVGQRGRTAVRGPRLRVVDDISTHQVTVLNVRNVPYSPKSLDLNKLPLCKFMTILCKLCGFMQIYDNFMQIMRIYANYANSCKFMQIMRIYANL